jgi:RHS repeat-associated protein
MPAGLAVDPDGSVFIADEGNDRVLRLANGILSLVAGDNGPGFSGDGGAATAAQLSAPARLALSGSGSVLVLELGNARVREVATDGTIRPYAGGGFDCTSDGIAATVSCFTPVDIAALSDGGIAIATSNRIRVVDASGTIRTIAGNGTLGSCGNHDAQIGVRALDAGVCPIGMTVGTDGSLYLTELSGQLLRRISPAGLIGQIRSCLNPLSSSASISPSGLPQASAFVVTGYCKRLGAGSDGSLYMTADSTIDRIDQILPQYRNAAFRIPAEDGSEIYEFSDLGQHLRTIDALTNVTLLSFAYDAQGRITSVTDLDNNLTTIQRGGGGVPTAIVSPYGESTALTIDGNGRLSKVTNPAGESLTLAYTSSGLLQSVTDPRQNLASRFVYDSLGRITTEQNALGGSQAFTRGIADAADTVQVTDALNRSRRVTDSRDRSLVATRVTVDAAGLQTSSSQRADGVTTTSSPDQTFVTQATTPDPRFGAQVRNTTQSTVRLPDNTSADVIFGRKVQLSNPTDPSSLVAQTDTLVVAGQTFRGVYTAATRTFVTTSPEGRSSSMSLDPTGRVARVTTTGLAPINYAYDSRGRLVSVTQGDRAETYTYNAQGRLQSITDPLNRVTSFDYDATGRVTSEVLPGARTVGFTYDSAGNLTSLTPPGKPAHTFSYNGANLPIGYQAPAVSGSTGATSYSYSVQKELLALTRPDSQTVSVGYDAAGRPASVTTAEGSHGISYDPATGQVASLSAPHGIAQTMTYNGALPIGTSWTGPVAGAVQYTYDNALRLSGILVNGNGIASPTYDRDGLPITNGYLQMTYRSDNGLLENLSAANYSGKWAYDSLAQVRTYTVVNELFGDTLFSASYTYDKLGRITLLAERLQTDTATYAYGYDAAGRLATVLKSGAMIAAYTYDGNGNRVQATYSSGNVVGTVDSQDRLLSYGASTYAYTGSGELRLKITGSDSTKYRYDAFGNLRDVYLPTGDHIEYLIDAQQRRIGRKLNGALQRGWLYQSQLAIAAEVDSSGAVTKTFEYATHANVPDWMYANGVPYRIVTDHLGSVRFVVDVSGTVAQRIDYDAYGRVIANSNPGFQPFGYAGGVLDDATGLTRFGARDYDAETGRWTVKDPIGFGGPTANLYSYGANDPATLSDPTGLWSTVVHNWLLERTFVQHHLSFGDLEVLRRASYAQDFSSWRQQSAARAYQHSQSEPGEDPRVAAQRRDSFVLSLVTRARALNAEGNRCAALFELGRALHTIADSYSPFHVDAHGNPLPWGLFAPVDSFGHVLDEQNAWPTEASVRSLEGRMWSLYSSVFGPR